MGDYSSVEVIRSWVIDYLVWLLLIWTDLNLSDVGLLEVNNFLLRLKKTLIFIPWLLTFDHQNKTNKAKM